MNDPETVDLSSLPAYVRERWPIAVERAAAKTLATVPDSSIPQLVKASQRASTAPQRVLWLHRAASAWAAPMEAVSGCRNGCCHIPVTISSVEADLIGRGVGLKPKKPARSITAQQGLEDPQAASALDAIDAARVHTPCPFLQGSKCSIYEVRPMACRLLVNLDDDDLLCRLVPGLEIPVPYADNRVLKGMYLMAQPTAPLADIRAFFPSEQAVDAQKPREIKSLGVS